MNVLVTGAAGFIGSNYVFYHLAAHPEDKIVVVDKGNSRARPKSSEDILL